jgi:hypothetical protein
MYLVQHGVNKPPFQINETLAVITNYELRPAVLEPWFKL